MKTNSEECPLDPEVVEWVKTIPPHALLTIARYITHMVVEVGVCRNCALTRAYQMYKKIVANHGRARNAELN